MKKVRWGAFQTEQSACIGRGERIKELEGPLLWTVQVSNNVRDHPGNLGERGRKGP